MTLYFAAIVGVDRAGAAEHEPVFERESRARGRTCASQPLGQRHARDQRAFARLHLDGGVDRGEQIEPGRAFGRVGGKIESFGMRQAYDIDNDVRHVHAALLKWAAMREAKRRATSSLLCRSQDLDACPVDARCWRRRRKHCTQRNIVGDDPQALRRRFRWRGGSNRRSPPRSRRPGRALRVFGQRRQNVAGQCRVGASSPSFLELRIAPLAWPAANRRRRPHTPRCRQAMNRRRPRASAARFRSRAV